MEHTMTPADFIGTVQAMLEVGGFALTEQDTSLFLKPVASMFGFGIQHTRYTNEEALDASSLILALILLGRRKGLLPAQTLELAFMLAFEVLEFEKELPYSNYSEA